jgi:hypothetical protein
MDEIKYTYDTLGNIVKAAVGDKVITDADVSTPEYNKITNEDDMAVAKAKRKTQVKLFEEALAN